MSPFAELAMTYFDLGWQPFPLPPKKKIPPPTGFTGYNGVPATRADIGGWIAEGLFDYTEDETDKDTGEITTRVKSRARVGNVGLWLADDILGIDIDDYVKDGRQYNGLASIAEATAELGVELPPTWISTSRPGTGAETRLYRVPPGRCWRGLSAVDAIRKGHRYVVAAPSIHPEGRPYVWISPDGEVGAEPPNVADLPNLPPEWVAHLDEGEGGGSEKAAADDATVTETLAGMPKGKPCKHITEASGRAFSGESRYDSYLKSVAAVVRYGRLGCPGAATTVARLREAYLAEVVGSGKGERTQAQAEGEWNRSLTGAVGLVLGDPQGQGCTDVSAWLPESESSEVRRVTETDYSAKSDESGPKVWSATDLKPAEPTRWLVRGHLPLAQSAVLIGDEGIGKSLWWVLIASHITTGMGNQLLGISEGAPRDVLLVLTEDSWTADVRPRLEAAGADLDHVMVIAEEDDGTGSPIFPAHMRLVHEAAEGRDLALIVVDAWLDTVSSTKQVKDPQQARQALHPWKDAAAKTGACVLLLAHSNRADEGSLRNRVGATGALRQKARVLLYAAQPPDSDAEMYLGPNKANGMAVGEALAYRVRVVQIRPATPDDPGTIARLELVGRTAATMEQHHQNWRAEQRRSETPPADDRVWDWLLDHIDANGIDSERGRYVMVKATQEAAHRSGHNPQRLARLVKMHGGYAGPGDASAPHIYRLPPSDGRTNSDKSALKGGQTSQSGQTRQTQEHGEVWNDSDLGASA